MSTNNINNANSNVKVNGTSDADYIYNSSHHVTLNAGRGDDTVEFASGSSRSVYNYADGDGNDTIIGFDNFTEGIIQLTSGTISNYSINSRTGDHVLKIGNGSITLKNVKTDKVAVKTKNKSYRYVNGKAFNDPDYNGDNFYSNNPVKGTSADDYINVGGDKVTISAGDGDDYIEIDNAYANKNFIINGDTGNDTIKSIGSYSTFVGGLGNDIIYSNSYAAVIKYNKGDGNDTIYGYNSTDTIQIINSDYNTTTSGQDVIISIDNDKMILKDAKDESLNIKVVTATLKDLETINLKNKDKSPYSAAANIGTINASKRKKAVKIIGNSNDNSIVGSIKNDTLIGGNGNDTLTGGKGRDLFVHASGDDVISDYKVGQDKIKLEGTSIISSSISGADVKLTTTKGTLDLKGIKGKKVTINASSKNASYIFSTGSIKGSKGKEIIYGSDSSDTIRGGKGNDTLIGNSGADVFFYTAGDGNDEIVDFSSDDVIKLGSKNTKVNEKKSKVSGSDYILSIGNSKIKLIGAADKSVTVIDYAGNSQTYNVQKNYVELFNDDNFAISASELDSILEPNFDFIDGKVYNDKNFDYHTDDNILFQDNGIRNSNGQGNHVINH